MRVLLLAAVAAAAASASYAREAPPALYRSDPFVISGNACNASAYAHLVGRPEAEIYQAALPARSRIVREHRINTLEYRPERLNVVLGGGGRVIAVGCF
jgi:hypothetical protein